MRFDYATSDENKIEAAKGVIRSRASVAKQEVVGFTVRQRSDYPKLQEHPATAGKPFWIVSGFTSAAELNAAGNQTA